MFALPVLCTDKRRLLVRVIQDTLAVHTYDAAVAGLNFSVRAHRLGLKISVYGFSQKLERLLRVVVDGILHPQFDGELFEAAKERVIRLLQNWSVARPDSHAVEYADLLLAPHEWSTEQELAGVQEATLEEVQAFHHTVLHEAPIYVKMFVNGNASTGAATDYFAQVMEMFQASPTLPGLPVFVNTVIPSGVRYNHESCHSNAADVNSSFVLLMQLPPHLRLEDEVLLLLLGQMIREPLFTQLRTKEKVPQPCT